jgi:bacterioferritin (cytochrome b1)
MKIKLRDLIKEEVTGKINDINKAGNKAVAKAKIRKLEDEINAINQIKNGIPVDLKKYVGNEVITKIMADLDKDIDELKEKIDSLSKED